MAFDFPSSPALNQQVVMPDGTVRQWDGAKWKAGGATATGPYLPLSGGAMSGSMTVVGNASTALQPVPLQQLSSTLATTAPSLNNVGRNLIHNGLFTIAQRGTGPFTGLSVYMLDRWISGGASDTVSWIQAPVTDGERAAIGDEAAQVCIQNTFTGNAAAGAYNELTQTIEKVSRLSGKTVTLSFWAIGNVALKIGINGSQ